MPDKIPARRLSILTFIVHFALIFPWVLSTSAFGADKPAPIAKPLAVKVDPVKAQLGGMVRGFFGPDQQNPNAKSAEPTTLLSDPATKRRLEEADRLLTESRTIQGLAVLQRILDEPEDSFVQAKGGAWISARKAAEQRIVDLGVDGLASYRLAYQDQAAALLREGVQANDTRRIGEVLRRFFLTPAGLESANLLAATHLDRGRPGLALFYLDRVVENPIHRDVASDALRAKRAVALALLDRTADAQQAMRGIGVPRLRLGGRERATSEILDSVSKRNAESLTPAVDWPMFLEDDRRTPSARGGMPLLTPEWSIPSVRPADHLLRPILTDIRQVNQAARRPTLLGFSPASAHGLIYVRDYRATSCVEPVGGRILWSQADPTSLSAQLKKSTVPWYSNTANQQGVQSSYVGNSVYGTLSTDGRLVFQIDELLLNPNPYLPRLINNKPNPEFDSRLRNRLTALDAKTGAVVWRAGGKSEEGKPAVDGTDVFFFGPPLPLNDRLYLLGEYRSELRLYCLEAATGRTEWSQVVAMSQRRIDSDALRRAQASFLAYADGILICPTNLFRVVAVDPLTRTLLWHYAFADDNSQPIQPAESMPYTFGPATACANDPPIVAGHRILLSASTGRSFHCVELQSGEVLWKADRMGSNYLAGVFGDRVILVGADHVRALDLATGKQAWREKISLPAGRGVLTGREFLVPLAEGAVLALDPKTGRRLSEVRSRNEVWLGNLFVAGGRVLSVGGYGLDAFPLLEDVRADVERLLAKDAADPRGLFRRGQLRLAEGDSAGAVTDLLASVERMPAGNEAVAARRLLFDVASREAIETPGAAGPLVEQLGKLASDDLEKSVFLRLRAEHCLEQRDFAGALNAVDAHASMSQTTPIDDSDRQVVRWPKVWTRWMLGRIFRTASGTEIAPIAADFEHRLQSAEKLDDFIAMESLASSLAGLPLGQQAALAVGKKHFEKGRLGESQVSLQVAAAGRDPALASAALLSLAKVSEKGDRYADSLYFRRILAHRFPNQAVADGETGRSLLDGALADAAWMNKTQATTAPWKFDEVVVRSDRNAVVDAGRRILLPAQAGLPYFSDRTFLFDPRNWSIQVLEKTTGKPLWKASLQIKNQSVPMRFDHFGNMVFCAIGDSICALSTLDQRVLWQRRLSDSPLGGAAGQAGFVVYPGMAMPGSPIALVGPGFLAVRAGKDLMLLDAWTRMELWSRRNVEPDQEVIGDEDYLFIVSRNGDYQAYRTADGEFLRKGNLSAVLPHRRDVSNEPGKRRPNVGRRLLLGRRERGRLVVRLWDPWSGSESWERGFPEDSRISDGDDGEVIVVERSGKATVLDPLTGRVLLQDSIGEDAATPQCRVHTFTDGARRFLAVDRGRPREQTFPIPQFPLITRTVNGPLRVYDLASGKLIWSKELTGHSVVVNPGEDLPIVVAMKSRLEKKENNQYRPVMTVELLDRTTGKSLYAKDRDDYAPVMEIAHDAKARWVELRSWNLKIHADFLTKEEIAAGKRPADEESPLPKKNQNTPFLERMRKRNLQPAPNGGAPQ